MGTHPIFESDFDCLTEMSFQRQINQINKVTSDSAGSSYNEAKENFQRKVMNDYHRSNKRNSKYKVDNTGGRRGGRRGYENDHDTRDDRKPRDVKKLTRKDNKNQRRVHISKNYRDLDAIDDDAHHMEDVDDNYQWIKVRLNIPKSELTQQLEFKDMIINRFVAGIPDFAERDIHIDGTWICFFIPRQGMNTKIGKIKDIVEEMKPPGRNNWIVVKHDPAGIPISVRFENIPNAQQILTEILQGLYNVDKNELDLSNLRANTKLMEHGMQLDLKKVDQFSLLVKILFTFDMLGNVCRSINLSNNCLRNLQPLQPLVERLKLIETLTLRSNEFRRWEDLDAIKEWKIKNLDLTECPLDRTKLSKLTRMKLQKEVRQRFKAIERFNGKSFGASIGIGGGDDSTRSTVGLPERLDSALPLNKDLEKQLIPFILDFIKEFDGDRTKLIGRYSDDAVFTMSVGWGTDLQDYRKHQRNMINFKHAQGGYNHGNVTGAYGDKYRSPHPNSIKKSKLQIIALFADLPATEHDLQNSTFLDVTFEMAEIIGFTLSGTLKEKKEGKVRQFSRHVLCRFDGNSFQIQHDQLYIRQATDQEKSQHGTKPQLGAQPTQPAATTITPEMIERFCRDSGMKPEYSRMCLEQAAGNYDQAGQTFMSLKAEGKIPAEYFVTPPS